jgi:hypothetical protein
MNLRRSPRFSFLLGILVVLLGVKVYRIWDEGLPELPIPVTEKSTVSSPKERRGSLRSLRRSSASIVKKNLFDPKRGAGGEKVAEPTPQSQENAEEFVLLGTMITSGGRKAIIRVSPTVGGGVVRGRRRRAKRKSNQTGEVRRVSLGDTVGEFQLAEIQPYKVILKKGPEQVELVLDFITRARKIEKPKIKKPEPKKRASRPKTKNSRRRPRKK